MAEHTSQVVLPYDFTDALALSVPERFEQALEKARYVATDYQEHREYPCVATTGVSEEELLRSCQTTSICYYQPLAQDLRDETSDCS